jgi:hypothetical protein
MTSYTQVNSWLELSMEGYLFAVCVYIGIERELRIGA